MRTIINISPVKNVGAVKNTQPTRKILFIKYFLIFGFLIFSLNPSSAYAYNCKNWVAKLQSSQGSVQVRQSPNKFPNKFQNNQQNRQWVDVKRNATFCKGDVLRVQENSRAALLLKNETILRLDQNTTITFTNLSPDKPSVVSISKGIGHFISRVKAAFEVITPFINAAIEGTEFVVSVKQNSAEVTVLEGTVRAFNQYGEVRLTTSQTAQAKQGQAPVLILKAKPDDAVNWSLYYPMIFDSNKDSLLQRASLKLSVGQIGQAEKLLQQVRSQNPNKALNSSALAMQAIINIVQNNKTAGLKLAQQAVAADNKNATAKLALSYAQQADFNITAALATLQQAVKDAKNSDTGRHALVWSRLAEVYLMHGQLDKALNAAKKARQLNPALAHTHIVLGFAYLTRIKINQAIASFNAAIEKDPANPLAHLGLGLAMIRLGHLAKGRREIEYATALDPNNALIRSYLGKAYYEEDRNKLAAVQFNMAKTLDPHDPTAYFYDAILQQSENKPVKALDDIQQAIKLNHNKAVYRSKQLLDQDSAVQALSQARFYNTLGLQQRALLSAQASLAKNPANHAAHRFMADAYAQQPRSEVARVSEALVAQLLQPINALPVQPKLFENNLITGNQSGIQNLTFNEYSPLFLQNGAYAYTNGFVGNDNTKSADIALTAVHNKFAFSLSAYRYITDGFRKNSDADESLYNAFTQMAVSPTLSIQAEAKKWQTAHGDIDMLFDPANFSIKNRRNITQNTQRIGIHQKPGSHSDIIVSLLQSDRNGNQKLFTSGSPTVTEDLTTDGTQSELQYILTNQNFNLQTGYAKHDVNETTIKVIDWTTVLGSTCPGFLAPSACGSTVNFTRNHDLAYIYTQTQLFKNLRVNLSGSYTQLETRGLRISKFNPKFGLQWTPTPSSQFRLAYFETVKRPLLVQQVIEPTQISGFNQFYDERNGTAAGNYALGIDASYKKLSFGLNAQRRDLRIPQFSGNAFTVTAPRREYRYRAYINFIASQNWSISFTPEKEVFNNQDTGPTRLYTTHLPLIANYHSASGFSASYKLNYVRQEVTLSRSSYQQTREDFITFDLNLGIKLEKRRGQLSLTIMNLFDQTFNYQDLNFIRAEPVYPKYLPKRTLLLKASINF